MSQFWNTIFNLIRLREPSLKLFKLLYKECPLEVTREKGDVSTIWTRKDSYEQWITVGTDYNRKQKLTALIHEIGHHKDYRKVSKNYNLWNYIKVEELSNSSKKKEKRAWKNAIKLADKYNIELDYKSAIRWLGTYGARYRVLENRDTSQTKE